MLNAANGASAPAARVRSTDPFIMSADAPLPHPDLVAAIPRLRRYARVLTGDAVRATQQSHVELLEVLRELARLPAEQREVLVLAAVEEMRYEEIATILSIPVGTVMSRLSRARALLQGSPRLRAIVERTAGGDR
jgi:RNA polymerase sigma factor (sigma-70 family)